MHRDVAERRAGADLDRGVGGPRAVGRLQLAADLAELRVQVQPRRHPVRDADVDGKRVLVRVDFNVPLDGERVTDDTRIRAALPTIEYLTEHGAKVILCSHLGRPDGKRHPKYSLEPVAKRLAELLDRDVLLSEECVGEGVHQMIHHSKEHQVILLENIRYYPEEEANDPAFARELSHLADVYVSDAFGTADPGDYDIVTKSCDVDRYGSVTFDGTIENTASRDLDFTINTEIRDSSTGRVVDSPSTVVYTTEGDTVSWEVFGSVSDSVTEVECKVTDVNNFGNF